MRITFIGNFNVDFSSESHYLKTFRKLGHEVHTVQENTELLSIDENYALQSDMVFWVHTHKWNTRGLEGLIPKLKERKIPIVGYHLDLWIGIEREKDLDTDLYWKALDYFFTVDPDMVDLLNSRENMPKGFFLPAGVYEDECYIGQSRPEFEKDVIFVGAYYYHPEWPYRKQLIDFLASTYGNRFARYASDTMGRQIRGAELNDLYASAKVVIGDTLCPGFKKRGYLSDRIFETTGRGGLLVHPQIEGMQDMFRSLDDTSGFSMDDEVIRYNFLNFKELKEKIDLLLFEAPEVREVIRNNGHERTKRDHTYTQRLTKLLEVVANETKLHL